MPRWVNMGVCLSEEREGEYHRAVPTWPYMGVCMSEGRESRRRQPKRSGTAKVGT